MFRYARALSDAWAERQREFSHRFSADELAFLPAHLELIESPPHPAPLLAARVVTGTVIIVAALCVFGHLDIVAVAPGELIPNANIKVIQPAVTGVIRGIHVQNGTRVVPGQLLVELDTVQAAADVDKALVTRLDAELRLARARALMQAQDDRRNPIVGPVTGATAAQQADARRLVEVAFREYQQKMSSLAAELDKRQAEFEGSQEQIAKLQQILPLAQQQSNDYAQLAQKNFVSKHDALEKQRALIDTTHELAAQKSRAREIAAGIAEQRRDIAAAAETFRREQLEVLNATTQVAAQSKDEEVKARTRQSYTRLTSPVSGIVQKLSVHTIGGVVTGAQALLEIVPDDALEVEARISDKDIGFVESGQPAVIKLAAFPYTRFGYLTGKVIKVSNDAIPDKKQGASFLARISIPSNHFQIEKKSVSLSPGMEVTAEIRTGRRRIWQYFLSPLIETGRESLRER